MQEQTCKAALCTWLRNVTSCVPLGAALWIDSTFHNWIFIIYDTEAAVTVQLRCATDVVSKTLMGISSLKGLDWRVLHHYVLVDGHWSKANPEGATCLKLLGMYRSSVFNVFKHQRHVFTLKVNLLWKHTMTDWSSPSFVQCIMWVTFRLYWVPAVLPRVVALEFYFWHAVLVSLVYQSREQCVVAYYGHVGFGQRSRVCGKGYHGIKTFFACPECWCVFSQSHVNNRNTAAQQVEDL